MNNTVTQKTPQISQIKRDNWDKIKAKRSLIPLVISLSFFQFIVAFFIVAILFLGGTLTSVTADLQAPVGLMSFAIILILVVDALYAVFAVSYASSIVYELQSNTFEVIKEFVDTRPGKIVIYSGFLFKKMRIYSLNEFHNVSVFKDFFGNIFNYGTIAILNNETDKKKRRILRLRAVKSPNDFARIIQSLIDTATSQMDITDSSLIKLENSYDQKVVEKPLHEAGNDYIKS